LRRNDQSDTVPTAQKRQHLQTKLRALGLSAADVAALLAPGQTRRQVVDVLRQRLAKSTKQ
jgi:hypothetical protein